ncbi:MAG: hypothetical protein AAFO76_14745 [Cyanobacteria bacterium J06607_15]
MTILDEQRRQAISRNFALVVDFLDRKFKRTPIHLQETPCYFYKRNKSKLEIVVFPDPRIAKVNVRIMGLKNYDREPSYECDYELSGLSIGAFRRAIEDLMSRMD